MSKLTDGEFKGSGPFAIPMLVESKANTIVTTVESAANLSRLGVTDFDNTGLIRCRSSLRQTARTFLRRGRLPSGTSASPSILATNCARVMPLADLVRIQDVLAKAIDTKATTLR